jgi:hypothetical protein
MYRTDLRRDILAAIALAFFLPFLGACAVDANADEEPTGSSAAIINKYLQATQTHEDSLRGASMQVNIDATVPKLNEHGTLRALRRISKVGQITYHVLGFQGDNTVKSQVIGRYLQAEQQGQGDQSLAIIPANYKFKFKGERKRSNGEDIYVFQLSPRKKKVGLFKGEMWLDANTYLPVREKGRLVKNPSIFFKKVEFQRDFAIRNGIAIPQHMTSTIDARLIGKVELNIDYSDFEQNAADDSDTTAVAASMASSAVK